MEMSLEYSTWMTILTCDGLLTLRPGFLFLFFFLFFIVFSHDHGVVKFGILFIQFCSVPLFFPVFVALFCSVLFSSLRTWLFLFHNPPFF